MPARLRNPKKENKRLWDIYHSMKKRCLNPNCKRYKDYGGRGIKICGDWLNGFDNFADWAKQNGYIEGLTIERKDVNGEYSPENCEWITLEQQARNKRDTIRVVYRGEEKTLISWREELNLLYDTMHDRIVRRKWSVEKAFETPSQRVTSISAICRERHINPQTVRDRVRKLGWPVEEALNTPMLGLGANAKSYQRNTK